MIGVNMNQKSWLLLVLAISLALSLWWLWPVEPPTPMSNINIQPTAALAISAPEVPAPPPAVQPKPEQLPQSMQQSFSLVAAAYADELQIPDYVRPLTLADSQLLAPNQFIAQQIPLEGGASVSIEADKYRFSAPEPVVVRLLTQGIELSQVQVLLKNELNGEVLSSEALIGNDGTYVATLPSEKHWDGPLIVEFQFSSDGQIQSVQTGIEYSQPVATITALKSVFARDSDMVIPVQIKVELAGSYRLRANLLTADGEPLAQLTATAELATGSQTLELKAHKMVLQRIAKTESTSGKSEQPNHYLLSTFQLERRSPSPFEPTRYGQSVKPEFELGDFDPAQLTDNLPDPSAEDIQRLEFLQKMAGG
jgi:hypothetical protein